MATKKSSSSTGQATRPKRTPKSKQSGSNDTGINEIVVSKGLLAEFQDLKIPYQEKSIFPSEMLFFASFAVAMECDQIIESGGRAGGSTEYLNGLFDDVHSVSRDRVDAVWSNVSTYQGDSLDLLPRLAWQSSAQRIAVLIDGPKGEQALALAKQLLSQCEKVQFVAVHDLTPELAAEGQATSQNATFQENFGFLDDEVGAYKEKYPVGPGLTIFSNAPIVPL